MNNNYTLEQFINKLSNKYYCLIYIEDYKGRLLYSTMNRFKDGWRNSYTLYSLPLEENVKFIKEKIYTKEDSYIKLINTAGIKDRIIIPIKIKNNSIAYAHLVFNQRNKIQLFSYNDINEIITNIYESFIEEMFTLFQMNAIDFDSFNYSLHENNLLLFIKKVENACILNSNDTVYIHYLNLFCKYVKETLLSIKEIENVTILNRQGDIYALITIKENSGFLINELQEMLYNMLLKSMLNDVAIVISANLTTKQLDKSIALSLKRILQKYSKKRGEVILQKNQYFKLFLLDWSTDESLMDYVKQILSPIILEETLLETLQAYMQSNYNVSQTAKMLYLNRKTISNRLTLIQNNLKLDLSNADDLFILNLCLKLYKLNTHIE